MTLSITFNGTNISKWLDGILLITRNVGQNRVPQLDQVGKSDGKMLSYIRADEGTIVVTAIVKTNITDKRRLLADALTTSTPAKLIFADEPGIYYNAISTGQITLDEAYLHNTLTITFTVPDGIAHSVATQTADNKDPKWNGSPLNLLAGTSDQETSGTVGINNWNAPSQHPNISVTSGQKFAYQIFITNDNTVDLTAGVDAFSGTAWKATYVGNVIKAGTSGYSSVTFTIPSGTDNIVANAARLVARVPTAKTTVYWQKEKLEVNTSVSPWSPNPADPEYYSDTITVTNSGTVPVPVKVTSQFSSDDGFLGLALNGRYYQVGNTKEVNGITYNDSQMLVKTRPTIDKYILNDPSFAVIPVDQGVMTQTGTVTINPDSTTYLGITTPSDFGPNNYGPHGPSLIYKLPPDSNGEVGAVNGILRMHAGLGALSLDSPSDTRQVGQICMTIYDKDKKAMARILYSDMSQTTSDFNVRFDLNEKKVHEEDFANSAGFTGHCYIRKTGSQFIFAWGGEAGGAAQTYFCEELADTKVMYVSFNFLQWADLPLPHYFGLIEWNFAKDYVNLYKDLPNYFKAGDIVTLDSSTNLLTINQYTDWDRVDIGSQPLLAPPGQSTLGIVVSPWANLPAVSTELREGWL
ncbi:distal tail protein Dit [Lacticaseibacillus paracasei]|uniref:distal tail protein Dit n=1 Tax=Lacticaseibacillus paracasei TaxID=1597 RepID=UPI0021A55E06|nr:distal tail protein Dit [Lacticaseibacillus paracasei]MCT4383889.1 phage tail protein [Lacticaseibacillus paracasei]